MSRTGCRKRVSSRYRWHSSSAQDTSKRAPTMCCASQCWRVRQPPARSRLRAVHCRNGDVIQERVTRRRAPSVSRRARLVCRDQRRNSASVAFMHGSICMKITDSHAQAGCIPRGCKQMQSETCRVVSNLAYTTVERAWWKPRAGEAWSARTPRGFERCTATGS